jgi:hypothetical protein
MMRLICKRTMNMMMIIALSLLVLGCKDKTTTTTSASANSITPSLTSPDAVFYQGATYAVTYGDIYDEFKINDGINQLLFMVDSALLSTYIASATADELAEKVKMLTYGTTDDTEIAALDVETRTANELSYAQNMVLLGYAGNEEAYLRMVVAKEKYTIEKMTSPDSAEQTWYVGDTTIAKYYDSYYFDDITAIKIRCYNEADALQMLRSFNLQPYKGTLRLYIGTTPIGQVPSSSFNDTNTRVLTNAELLSYFIQMYNTVYGTYRTPLAVDATIADLQANADLQISYETLTDIQPSLATHLFSSLSSYVDFAAGTTTELCYTYAPAKYYGDNDTATYLMLKISNPTKADMATYDAAVDGELEPLIGQETYDAIAKRMIDANIETSGFVALRIGELRAEHHFDILDYYLGVDYQSAYAPFEPNLIGHATVVASYDSINISADTLLTYALNKNGALYAMYAAQMAVVMDSYFASVYCTEAGVACETDISKNTSAKITEHKTTLAALRTSFEASYYVYYYTFEEYIYLAYGAKSEADMIAKYYVKSTLQPYLIYEKLKSEDWALLTDYLYGLIQDYYDNYFSLDVSALSIYLDRDENGKADDYLDFVAGLADPVAYATLVGNFETAIRTYLADENNNFVKLIVAYNRAGRNDATWGVFKQYGFCLSNTDLSSEASLTYLTTLDAYEDSMIQGFIAAYAEYQLPANEAKDSIYFSELVESKTGLVLLECSKGSDFEKPSAAFTMTYGLDGLPNYTVGTENATDLPTLAQLKLYCEKRFYEIVYGTGDTVEETYGITIPVLPTSLITAMEAYFLALHDSMYVIGFLNIIVDDQLQTGTFTNTVPSYCTLGDATLKANLVGIRAIYFQQVFEKYDTIG